MTFAHASNAIGGFFVDQLSFNDSPWDQFLAGNDKAMTTVQLQGAKNFMSARCSICHNGPALQITSSTTWPWRSSGRGRAMGQAAVMTSAGSW